MSEAQTGAPAEVQDHRTDLVNGSPTHTAAVARPKRRWRSLVLPLIALSILPGGLAAWSLIRYGSLNVGLAALRGDAVALSSPDLNLGTIRAGEEGQARLQVWNLTPKDLQLIGGRTNCSCVRLKDLTATIPAERSHVVEVSARPWAALKGPNRKEVELYTNRDVHRSVVGTVRFTVLAP